MQRVVAESQSPMKPSNALKYPQKIALEPLEHTKESEQSWNFFHFGYISWPWSAGDSPAVFCLHINDV